MMADRRWLGWLTGLLLALVLVAWLWRLLVGETLFWGLPSLQFYPWRSFAFSELRAGRLPVWNPYNGGGVPLLANYQVAVFYPPNWLHLVLSDVLAMNLLAVGHIVLAAVGMWVFAGCWQLPCFGRAMATMAFALSGYLIPRMGSFPTVAAAAWLPWLLWAVHCVIQRPHVRTTLSLALVCALLLLSGHAQTAYYVVLMAAIYGVWLAWFVRRRNRIWPGLVWAAGGGLLGVGIAMIQLLPTAELLGRSARADGLHYEWTTNFSYSLARALTLLAPNLYGTPADGTYLTEGAYFEDAAYLGLLPLIAALFAGLYWIRSRQDGNRSLATRSVPFWFGIAVVSFLIALGKNGFLFPLLYRYVPSFQLFQGPVRWLILLEFSLALLAGIGVSYAWQSGKWSLFWSRLTVAGGLGMAALAAFGVPRLFDIDSEPVRVMMHGLIVLGVLGAGCGLLTLLQPADRAGRRHILWQAGVLIFVAVDLFWAFKGLNPTVPASFFAAQPDGATSAELLYMPEVVEQRLKFDEFFTFNDYRVAVDHWPALRRAMLPNLNMIDGLRMYNNFDPIDTQAHVDSVAALEATLSAEATSVIVLDQGSVQMQEPFGWDALALGSAISGICAALTAVLWFRFGRLADWAESNREGGGDVL